MKRDRIINENIIGTVKVFEISKKIQESRLRWYGHLRRRDGEDHVGIEMQRNRKTGRPKRRIMNCINGDLREKNLILEKARNRNTWRKLIHNVDPE